MKNYALIVMKILFINLVSWMIVFLYSIFMIRKKTEVDWIHSSFDNYTYDKKEWRMSAGTIMISILGWSILGRSDVVFLALFVPSAEVASYFICMRIAELLTFFSTVSFYLWSGEISNLYHQDRMIDVQKLLTRSTGICLISCFIAAILGLIFSAEILGFINPGYNQYALTLKICLIGFFISGSAGILNPMLYVAGEEKFLAKSQWIIGMLFLSMIFLLVPKMGINGCALAFLICQIIYVIVLSIQLKMKTGLFIIKIY